MGGQPLLFVFGNSGKAVLCCERLSCACASFEAAQEGVPSFLV